MPTGPPGAHPAAHRRRSLPHARAARAAGAGRGPAGRGPQQRQLPAPGGEFLLCLFFDMYIYMCVWGCGWMSSGLDRSVGRPAGEWGSIDDDEDSRPISPPHQPNHQTQHTQHTQHVIGARQPGAVPRGGEGAGGRGRAGLGSVRLASSCLVVLTEWRSGGWGLGVGAVDRPTDGVCTLHTYINLRRDSRLSTPLHLVAMRGYHDVGMTLIQVRRPDGPRWLVNWCSCTSILTCVWTVVFYPHAYIHSFNSHPHEQLTQHHHHPKTWMFIHTRTNNQHPQTNEPTARRGRERPGHVAGDAPPPRRLPRYVCVVVHHMLFVGRGRE